MKNSGKYPGSKRPTGFKSLPEAASRTTKPIEWTFHGTILRRGGIRTAGNVIGSLVSMASIPDRRETGPVSSTATVTRTTKNNFELPRKRFCFWGIFARVASALGQV